MNTCDLPVDTWIVVKRRSAMSSSLISMHDNRNEAEAARDKLNKTVDTPCYSACIVLEPVARGMGHARLPRGGWVVPKR